MAAGLPAALPLAFFLAAVLLAGLPAALPAFLPPAFLPAGRADFLGAGSFFGAVRATAEPAAAFTAAASAGTSLSGVGAGGAATAASSPGSAPVPSPVASAAPSPTASSPSPSIPSSSSPRSSSPSPSSSTTMRRRGGRLGSRIGLGGGFSLKRVPAGGIKAKSTKSSARPGSTPSEAATSATSRWRALSNWPRSLVGSGRRRERAWSPLTTSAMPRTPPATILSALSRWRIFQLSSGSARSAAR